MNIPYIAIVLTVISGLLPASAAENKAISEAGLKLPSIEIPAPATPKSNQWLTLRKIQLNTAQPEADDTLVGMVQHGQDIDKVVKELTEGGFKVKAYRDNSGGYMVMADVKGLDAADLAVGLARYYYITEVKVGQKTLNELFGFNNKSAGGRSNQWLTLRKIQVNTAQPDMNDMLIGMVQHGAGIDKVIKELTEGGFKIKSYQDNSGGYMVMADVKGLDAADLAVGLARYYYITEVKVGQAVYNNLFGLK